MKSDFFIIIPIQKQTSTRMCEVRADLIRFSLGCCCLVLKHTIGVITAIYRVALTNVLTVQPRF